MTAAALVLEVLQAHPEGLTVQELRHAFVEELERGVDELWELGVLVNRLPEAGAPCRVACKEGVLARPVTVEQLCRRLRAHGGWSAQLARVIAAWSREPGAPAVRTRPEQLALALDPAPPRAPVPEQLDADAAPEQLDADVAPEQLDADVAPEQLDADVAPEQLDADVAPEQLDADVAPEQLDADAAPEQLDADAAPEQLDADAAPEQLDDREADHDLYPAGLWLSTPAPAPEPALNVAAPEHPPAPVEHAPAEQPHDAIRHAACPKCGAAPGKRCRNVRTRKLRRRPHLERQATVEGAVAP
ncbi:zinc finger domain-containing protein [Sorangium sp. So ce1024]|uniref:zinc finger domain-containing protein n=1 Tax=Sorangium sp. So ce1024 TaxID=3133327 RepID=UPI003EFCD6CD